MQADPAPPSAPVRATARFMRAHPAHWIALGFGSGLSPVAPGTAGTLWAWLAWALLSQGVDSTALGVVIAVSTLVGWWACTVTARHLNTLDPSNIVWDEVVAFWLVLWIIAPAGWLEQTVAFALFRLFDAVKRGPVGWADRTFHGFGPRGGFGILADDFVAAFLTLLVMAAGKALL
ncbi:phosphatidylglycerophosphatase A [Xylophilus sp. GOD-11R]|uniref:phosphatidylglycerophosphatase A family protein n=1 Tax=Xylophilus sp. GOD-11R TaxID=3089814 RepID=UPI00298BE323|nr:phosphatidylglycerophosphatase A [Xylophilus sp. GOD-11R]WPB57262.1 phosphatidylglycerophosphatase A [Xylophilus sp. GOD-11R]